MSKVEFNNGFITAIALFLEHRDNFFGMNRQYIIDKKLSDHRMYAGSDHLYDLEIPKTIPENIRNRILRWKKKCFENRLSGYKANQLEVNDKLFKEAEDILIKIDELVFKTKKVKVYYR